MKLKSYLKFPFAFAYNTDTLIWVLLLQTLKDEKSMSIL